MKLGQIRVHIIMTCSFSILIGQRVAEREREREREREIEREKIAFAFYVNHFSEVSFYYL